MVKAADGVGHSIEASLTSVRPCRRWRGSAPCFAWAEVGVGQDEEGAFAAMAGANFCRRLESRRDRETKLR